MNQIIVKIPRRKQKIKIVSNEDIIRREFDKKIKELEAKYLSPELEKIPVQPEPELLDSDDLIEEVPAKANRTYFSEIFTISDSNEPIEINLGYVPGETISIDYAAHEIQSAYDRGLNDGHDSAKAIFQAEIQLNSEWIKRFDRIAFKLKKEFIREMRQFEDSLTSLSILIAERIVDSKIDNKGNVVIAQLKKAFKQINDDEVFRITVSEADYEVLHSIGSQLFDEIGADGQIPLFKSAKINKGDCILHTSAGIISARISTQLDKMKESLIDVYKQKTVERETKISDEYPEILDTILPDQSAVQDMLPQIEMDQQDDDFDFDDIDTNDDSIDDAGNIENDDIDGLE